MTLDADIDPDTDLDLDMRYVRWAIFQFAQTLLNSILWGWPYWLKSFKGVDKRFKNANFGFIECGIISCLARQP